MRMMPIFLVLMVVGCGGPAEEPATNDSSATAASRVEAFQKAAEKADANRASPSAKPARGLATPLPGDVVPDFDYMLIVDMSSRANFTMRQIGIGARDLSADEAMGRLAAQLTSAGFTAGDVSEHRDAKLMGFWKGGGEARGMVVVSEGGTYINVIATEKDEAQQAKDGFRSLLMVTVYTPL